MGHMDPFGSKERLERLVAAQSGRITRAQLRALGVSNTTIRGWIETGRLHRVLPRVYAVGHAAPSREADLWAAILYAGPGAMLSHATAAHWRGLIHYPPARIEVTTPRKIRSLNGVRVYAERRMTRRLHDRLPVTADPRTLVDLAATSDFRLVRRALSVLDFKHELDLPALTAICKHGRPGSKLLREALNAHQPQLARTNSPLEVAFIEWCERWKVPVPNLNVPLHGIIVDAYWPTSRLVVELDGYDNHRSRAQLRKDTRNDLTLRAHELTVRRYDWSLLNDEPQAIHDEILQGLNLPEAPARRRPAPSAPPPPPRRPGQASPPQPSG